jgi:hypothetical protein
MTVVSYLAENAGWRRKPPICVPPSGAAESPQTTGPGAIARGGQFPSSYGREQNVIGSSICRKPLLFHASTQTKAFVTPGRDLVAFFLVCGDAADIRHENTGFPRDVGADVP